MAKFLLIRKCILEPLRSSMNHGPEEASLPRHVSQLPQAVLGGQPRPPGDVDPGEAPPACHQEGPIPGHGPLCSCST